MIVEKLFLRNFRNYEEAEIQFNPHMNILIGENAQGKTNLLESLVFLSLTRSHRISDEKKLIRKDQPFADIRCVYVDDDIKKELEVIIHPKGKTLMIQHNPVKRSSEFIGLLNVVLFSPDDLTIFNDQPRDRRRIMNQEITKINSSYLRSLNRSQNLLKERNLLLKNDHVDFLYLDTLDEELSIEESLIIEERKKFTRYIKNQIPLIYQELSGDDTVIDLHYKCCIDPKGNIQDSVRSMHKENRERDLEMKMTTNGIHREDLIFQMNDMNLIQVASQGQKRMTMLAFKIALMRYIKQQTNKEPVLLLDDVLSELDLKRQKRLLTMIMSSGQCLITATNIPDYLKNENITIFYIDNGHIQIQKGGIA